MGNAPATGHQMSELIQIGVIAMHQLGMIPQSIADVAGCARSTVVAILNNVELVEKYTNQELVNKLKKSFPDRIFAKCNAVLANIDPDDPNVSQSQRAVIFGVLFDKYLLSTGRATQIIDYKAVTGEVTDIDAKIVELENKLRLGASKQRQITQVDSKG
jgi:hypothetical protein